MSSRNRLRADVPLIMPRYEISYLRFMSGVIRLIAIVFKILLGDTDISAEHIRQAMTARVDTSGPQSGSVSSKAIQAAFR